MSINSLLDNPYILDDLALALAPSFPDTGVTSLVNTDGNVVPTVTGRVGTINLAHDLSMSNLTVNASCNLKGLIKLGGSSGTSGQVLTSQGGSSNPIWTTATSGITSIVNTDSNLSVNTASGTSTVNFATDVSVGSIVVNQTTNLKKDLLLNGSAGTAGQILASAGAGSVPTWISAGSSAGLQKYIYSSQTQQSLSSQVTLTLFNKSISGLTVGKTELVRAGITMYLDSGGSLYPILYDFLVDGVSAATVTSYAPALYEHFYREFVFSFISTATSHTLTLKSHCVGGFTLNIVDSSDYYNLSVSEVQ